MDRRTQSQIDTEEAKGRQNEQKDDSFYRFPSRLREPLSSSESEAYAPNSYMEFAADKATSSSAAELYAFKIIDDGDGTVSVTTGTVNTETATNLTPAGKPTELWLKVTFSATTGEVTAAVIATTSSAASETNDSRQVGTITWDGDTPTIVQGIKGSQSIASCGATHQWGTLYS